MSGQIHFHHLRPSYDLFTTHGSHGYASHTFFSYCTDTPFNQLPVLEVDGVSIAQTKTIMAYLGKRLGR